MSTNVRQASLAEDEVRALVRGAFIGPLTDGGPDDVVLGEARRRAAEPVQRGPVSRTRVAAAATALATAAAAALVAIALVPAVVPRSTGSGIASIPASGSPPATPPTQHRHPVDPRQAVVPHGGYTTPAQPIHGVQPFIDPKQAAKLLRRASLEGALRAAELPASEASAVLVPTRRPLEAFIGREAHITLEYAEATVMISPMTPANASLVYDSLTERLPKEAFVRTFRGYPALGARAGTVQVSEFGPSFTTPATILWWAEHGHEYELSSTTLSLEQLEAFANRLLPEPGR